MPSQKLKHFIIRVAKEHAAFTYFLLEANEGLCFHSTLSTSLKQPYRDIEIFSPMTLEPEIDHLLTQVQKEHPVEFLVQEIVEDARGLGQEFKS